ncbi:MAG: 2-hydroxychromene-2-carboxylate isomerase, partial [Hyphomicrobiaceae bacterium]
MTTVDYYISLNSPWTYLAGARFLAMRDRLGFSVRVRPARFADVFAATGGLPLPKRSPQRQAYRLMELKRWRDRLGLPITLEPRHFPSDETRAAWIVIAADAAGLDAARFAMEIGRELWERDTNIAEPAALKTAAQRAGLDYDQLADQAPEGHELEAAWKANTAAALDAGVFGAPSFVLASGEIFWGQDRLDFL